MQPLQICIGHIIRIGRESWCLPYAGFFLKVTAISFQSGFLHILTFLTVLLLLLQKFKESVQLSTHRKRISVSLMRLNMV